LEGTGSLKQTVSIARWNQLCCLCQNIKLYLPTAAVMILVFFAHFSQPPLTASGSMSQDVVFSCFFCVALANNKKKWFLLTSKLQDVTTCS